jgi:hypothetical protein
MAWRTAEAGLSGGRWLVQVLREVRRCPRGRRFSVGAAGTIWKRPQLVASLCRMLQIPSVTAFEKTAPDRRSGKEALNDDRRPDSTRTCSLIGRTLVV